MIEETLKSIGLTPEEIEIYMSLLSFGTLSPTELSSKTKVKRTYVYKICEDLVEKRLVTPTKKGNKKAYAPASPDYLLSMIDKKKQELISSEQQLERILNELKEKYSAVETRPVVSFYEGESGIKKVFSDIYSKKNEPVWGCGDLEKSDKAIPGYVIKNLVPLRIKNKVFAKSLIAKSPQSQELKKNDATSFRETILLDKEEYPVPAEIDVYEDKVALLSFERDKFVGVLIQNAAIATSLKSVFKLAFSKRER